VADGTVRYACRAAKIKNRSTLGLTFVWRLNFLAKLDEKERTDLLGRLARRTGDPVVQRMIAETPMGISEPGKWNPEACTRRFAEVIERSGVATDLAYHLDLYRNRLAGVFLRSFEQPFLRAVRADFLLAFDFSLPEVTTYPIAATRYCFGRIEEMPQLKNLATFRGSGADAALSARERTIYFRLIDVRLRNLLMAWGALSIVAAVLGRRKSVVIYSAVLVGVGILMVLVTCFLSELLPRFLLPFWALFVPATLLSVGSLHRARAPHRASWDSH
jgi:hypothetical protein